MAAFYGKLSLLSRFLSPNCITNIPGITLDGENKTKTWSQKILFPEPGGGEYVTKLAVKQILLGHDAKKDEVNVVEVTTDGWSRDGTLQKIPIAVLKLGETQSSLPNLEFPSLAVKFTLTVGSGPVHITGLQFPDAFSDSKGDHEVSKRDVLLRQKIQITIYIRFSGVHG